MSGQSHVPNGRSDASLHGGTDSGEQEVAVTTVAEHMRSRRLRLVLILANLAVWIAIVAALRWMFS